MLGVQLSLNRCLIPLPSEAGKDRHCAWDEANGRENVLWQYAGPNDPSQLLAAALPWLHKLLRTMSPIAR